MERFERYADIGSLGKIIQAMGLMSSEFMFIADVKRLQWNVLSIGTRIQKLLGIEDECVLDSSTMTKKMFDDEQIAALRHIREIMLNYWRRNQRRDDSIVFEPDSRMKISENKTIPIHLTVLPLSKKGGDVEYIVLQGNFLTCGLEDKLLARHFKGSPTMVYDSDIDEWKVMKVPNLSEIEEMVLVLSAQGRTLKDVVDLLEISENTLKAAKKRLFKKLGVDNMTSAIATALTYRIL